MTPEAEQLIKSVEERGRSRVVGCETEAWRKERERCAALNTTVEEEAFRDIMFDIYKGWLYKKPPVPKPSLGLAEDRRGEPWQRISLWKTENNVCTLHEWPLNAS